MAPSATAPKAAGARGARAPRVNLFDMPELMPGAQPSANPAQREEFQQRCRQLHRDEEAEQHETAAIVGVASGSGATAQDLEAMFPALDPVLVRTLLAEAPSAQHAIDTLLALSAAVSEPVAGGEAQPRAASPPPRKIGVEDHKKFPSLVDGAGWQVVNQRSLDQDTEEDLGSAWRDRAKAAADLPAPRAAPSPAAQAAAAGQSRRRQSRPKEEEWEPRELPTDYDFRQRAGQRRAQHRVQYGRRGRNAAARGGRGAAAPNGGSNTRASGSDESESEEEAPE